MILTPKPSHCATVSARPASSMSLSARCAPLPGQRVGERPPDARTRPGDGGDPAAEVLHGSLLVPLRTPTGSRAFTGARGPENSMMESSMSLIFRAR